MLSTEYFLQETVAEPLRTLRRGIERADDFCLFVAVCNRPSTVSALIDELRRLLPNEELEVVRFDEDTKSPLTEAEQQAGAGTTPVMLVGLEKSNPSFETEHPVLWELNLSRPEWPQRLPRPVVLWVPEYMVRLLEREAPDFLDWRSDTFFFADESEPYAGIDRLESWVEGDWEGGLSVEGRRERIKDLQARLARHADSKDRALVTWWMALGRHHLELAQLDEAENAFHEAAAALGEEDETAEIRLTLDLYLAEILYKTGQYADAEAAIRSILESQGETSDGTTMLLHNLATAISSQGKYGEAEQLLRESLDIKEKTLGKNHMSYGASLHELASVLSSQGKYGEAEQLLRESLDIKEKALGKSHPSVAATLHNLAGAVADQGKLEESEPLFRRALSIARDTYGPDHPDVAISAGSLANLQAQMGHPDASATAEQALQGLLASLGPEHPIVQRDVPGLQQIIQAGRLNKEIEGLAPKERQARLAEIQARTVGINVRDGVVQTIEAGADLAPIVDQLEANLKKAEENDDAPIASFFRSVIAVLNGDEPANVPSLFQEYVDAIREAVRET